MGAGFALRANSRAALWLLLLSGLARIERNPTLHYVQLANLILRQLSEHNKRQISLSRSLARSPPRP